MMPPSATISNNASAPARPRCGIVFGVLLTRMATGRSPPATPSLSGAPVMRFTSGAGPIGISGPAFDAVSEDGVTLLLPDDAADSDAAWHALRQTIRLRANAKAIKRFVGPAPFLLGSVPLFNMRKKEEHYSLDYITAGQEGQSISTKLAVSLSSPTVSAVSVWAVPVLL